MPLCASLEALGFSLGLLALLVSIVAIPIALREGRKQIRALNGVRRRLEAAVGNLRGEVETHYIGKFPDFMPDIIDVLRGAEKDVTIFCDLPAYGVVSNPRCFQKYMRAIEERAEDVPVRMLHLNAQGREVNLRIQAGDEWSIDGSGVAFAQSAGATPDIDRGEFLNLVEREQVKALARFKDADVVTNETDLLMPLYFWIADQKRAVFALTQFDPEAHEAGFVTASPNLIAAMRGIFERYQAAGGASSAKSPTSTS